MGSIPGHRRKGSHAGGERHDGTSSGPAAQRHDQRRVRLSVIETGAGPPFVILPAWTNSAAEYHGQVREFARDHRVLAIDMRAHGEAEHGHRVNRYAADLHDILAALDVNNAVLIGHSMGCSLIWSYLDLYGPGRIAGLVLGSTSQRRSSSSLGGRMRSGWPSGVCRRRRSSSPSARAWPGRTVSGSRVICSWAC